MAKVRQANDLRYYPLFALMAIGVAIGWNAVAKATAERTLLPVLCPEADPASGPLRVTNNDGTLSNGAKLRGWRHSVYFGVHGGLWMVGCTAITIGLAHVWPRRITPDEAGGKGDKKPAPMDDLV